MLCKNSGREYPAVKEARKMRLDMPLDYALFQLDSTRSRCELWISAGGVTEKLASGLLKPFLAHLRAAQEQISSGAQSIRLQAPSVTANGRNSGAAWFSKGTMERFVCFVSIPEVLERVSAVEAECQRLEEAINILATEEGGDHLFDTSVFLPSVVKPVDEKITNKTGGLKKELKQDYHDSAEAIGDASKKQLLRAMDGRRVMLAKEQRKALAQAVAAGFNMECMSDLVVFADCFGALQLRDACVKFMALRKKIQEYGSLIDEMELAAETVSTGLKMNRSGIILVDADAAAEIMPMGFLDDPHEKLVIESSDNKNPDKISMSGFGKVKGRKFASKPDAAEPTGTFKREPVTHLDFRRDARRHSVGKFHCGPNNMEVTENSHIGKKKNLFNCSDRTSDVDRSFATPGVSATCSLLEMNKADAPLDTSIVQEQTLHSDHEATDSSRRHLDQRSSPKRRYGSPFKKVEIEYSPVCRQGVIVTRSFGNASLCSKGAGYAKKNIGVDADDSGNGEKSESRGDSDEERQGSRSESRRLSVQDAISLFESKRKESTEVPLQKHCLYNNHNESEQCEIRAARGKDVLRRWSVPGPESVNAYDCPEKVEDVLSTNINISTYQDTCNTENKSQSREASNPMTFKKGEKLLSVSSTVDGDVSHVEHEIEKEELLEQNLESMIINHFDAQTSRQQVAENSGLQTRNTSSVSLELERKQNHRPMEQAYASPLTTLDSASQSASPREQVESFNNVVKYSVLEHSQALKSTVVKRMLPSERATPSDQRKSRQHDIGLTSNIRVHHQAVVGKVPGTKRLPKASLDDYSEMVSVEKVPQESNGIVTNVPHQHNPHRVKERIEGSGCQKRCVPSLLPTNNLLEKIAEKGNVRKSWSTPSDFHLEALAQMVDNKDNEDEHELNSATAVKDLQEHFYEQYQQKRDAKLRQESGFKKAERDAKMKAMQEVLEQRKEELTARGIKLNDKKHADSVHTEKTRAIKEGLTKNKKEKVKPSKEMGGKKQQFGELRSQQQRVGIDASNLQECQSATSTPRIVRANIKNTKPNTARKVSPSSQKPSSLMVIDSGTRSTGSCSPKSFSRTANLSGAKSSQCQGSSGIQAKMAETLFCPSVPSASELRKESAKPHLTNTAQFSYQTRGMHSNDSYFEDFQLPYALRDKVVDFDGKELILPETLVQNSGSISEFQKSVSLSCGINQQNLVEASESLCVKDGQSDMIFTESDVTFEAAKVYQEESAEFCSQSHSDNVLKSFVELDAEKIHSEEEFSSSSSNTILVEPEEPDKFSPCELEETSRIEEISPICINTICDTGHIITNAKELSPTNETVHPVHTDSGEVSGIFQHIEDVSAFPKTAFQEEEMEPNLLSLDLPMPVSSFVEPERPQSSNLDGLQPGEMFQSSEMDVYDVNCIRSLSAPLKALKLQDILHTQETDSLPPLIVMPSDRQVSLSNSIGYHHLSASTTSPSMIPRLSSRSYPQAHLSASTLTSTKPDSLQSRKLWNNSQKSVSMNSQHAQKEPSKVFKRFLKFGRRSRGSEPSSQDWVAASTSEGDEDGDESKTYLGEDDLTTPVGGSSNTPKNIERGSRAIDFDSINAPRSFFSLSSFRSKSGESRSRA